MTTKQPTHTALIVPAMSDMAGRCRIVARRGDIHDALWDYRDNPRRWKDVGLTDSRGELVCCEPYGDLVAELKACEPLRAGLVVPFIAPDCPI